MVQAICSLEDLRASEIDRSKLPVRRKAVDNVAFWPLQVVPDEK
jgi:hypothetical protein